MLHSKTGLEVEPTFYCPSCGFPIRTVWKNEDRPCVDRRGPCPKCGGEFQFTAFVVQTNGKAAPVPMPPPEPEKLLDVTEIARRMRIHTATISQCAKRGELRGEKRIVNGHYHWLFTEGAVKEWMKGRKKP